MKIGIDARWIFEEFSGIGVYTRELIRALVELESDAENRYILFFDNCGIRDRTLAETGAGNTLNFRAHMLPFGLFSAANQLRLPGILAGQRLDIFHSTNYMIPLAAFPSGKPGRVRCVTTIHDLIPLIFPQYTPRSRKRRFFRLYRLLMRQAALRSDVIITDSQCSRSDVLRHLRISPGREDRVLAIPVGVSPSFGPEPPRKPRSETESEVGGGGPCSRSKTVLWVGRPDPYKNLVGLVKAFALLRKERFARVSMRLAGPRDDRYPEASQLASSLGVRDYITWLGYVSDEVLVREYQNADVLVLPSLYEGFGMPVIEAMACGTPVVCSNRGSLPEAAGDAAIVVQPDDIVGIAEAVKRVLTDPRLANDMAARGLRHASKYRWSETARRTLDAYRMALQ